MVSLKAAIKDGENPKERLLARELTDDRDDGVQYKRLPFGMWFLERIGILSTLSPTRKKKL